MRTIQIIVCLGIVGLLVWMNLHFPVSGISPGGISWLGWASIGLIGLAIGFVAVLNDTASSMGIIKRRSKLKLEKPVRILSEPELKELHLDKYRGPSYPHPIIFPDRCIGCQACVDACPHDVLAIVDGRASAVAPDLCMEDTACQAECPVNPKACIVINTAKEVRSLPIPTRDGGTFQTNVPGCFIIGDVSGVPLIKNAVKEGAEVVDLIAAELRAAAAEPRAEYDVAIIGVGPGGASAAATAQVSGLRYVAIEQDTVLSTIEHYPKGKYIFFKPDTKDWSGGIPVAGLGLSKAKYGQDAADDTEEVFATLGPTVQSTVYAQAEAFRSAVIARIPAKLRPELDPLLIEKLKKEFKKRVVTTLKTAGSADWANVYRSRFEPQAAQLFAQFGTEIADQLQAKIPGDSRENILKIWHTDLEEKGVRINEMESCKQVTKSADGDYFVVKTERGIEKEPQTYTARKVVIGIGLRGAPNKLRLPNEEMKFSIEGREEQKVLYQLSDPMQFRGRNIVVVGGGNVAVEAAVDLVAIRDGATISPRRPEDMNRVTLLVRDFLAPTVKFGNKLQLYKCAENGLIDLRFGVGIKEMREHEVVLENVRSKEVVATVPNDYVFALIGGERPNRFLESIGISIK